MELIIRVVIMLCDMLDVTVNAKNTKQKKPYALKSVEGL